jgi:phenylalanyl-tRNA synthetase beta chain
MKVIYSWLQELIPNLQATPLEIAKKLTESGIEIDGVETLKNGDSVIELDLTPNRSDCLSMWGAAYEVGAVLGLPVQIPALEALPIHQDHDKIILSDPSLCPTYLALMLHDVQIGNSPEWMQQRLEALGMRSINNIVDITNYVMMETGQPLHAFDYDCLENHQVVVRPAETGESLLSLDGQRRELPIGTILICDPKKPIGIGGIMGGLNSEVTSKTKTILFEAAYFERRSIRRSAKALDLRSEAAIRFEKGVDPSGLLKALQRVVHLAKEMKIGRPDEEVFSATAYEPKQHSEIVLRRRYLDSRIGLSFPSEKVEQTLRDLNFEVASTEEGWMVEVPSRRQDIEQEVDLVEEVARLIGFQQIPAQLPIGATTQGGLTMRQKLIDRIHQIMIHQGYHEAVNYSFIAKQYLEDLYFAEEHPLRQAIPLLNPMNDTQGVMRTCLIPGILRSLQYNQNHQNPNVALYELGRVYLPNSLPLKELPQEETRLTIVLSGEYRNTQWMQPKIEASFFHLKGVLEAIMSTLHWPLQIRENHTNAIYHPYQCADIILHGKVVGTMGALHPDIEKQWDFQRRVFVADLSLDLLLQFANPQIEANALSRYQAIYRDLALLVPKQTPAREVEQAIQQQGGELLEAVKLFDVYTGVQVKEGFKSLAFALTYRAADRTLTDQEVVDCHNEILRAVSLQFDSSLRT